MCRSSAPMGSSDAMSRRTLQPSEARGYLRWSTRATPRTRFRRMRLLDLKVEECLHLEKLTSGSAPMPLMVAQTKGQCGSPNVHSARHSSPHRRPPLRTGGARVKAQGGLANAATSLSPRSHRPLRRMFRKIPYADALNKLHWILSSLQCLSII